MTHLAHFRRTTIAALLLAISGITTAVNLLAQQPDAAEIIRTVDSKQTHDHMKSRGTMIIHDNQLGERSSSFISYAQGKFNTMFEFTSGSERGQKILRTEDKLYLYSPRSADIILLQGAALRQSLAGSDVSYEDVSSTQGTLEKYNARLRDNESLQFQGKTQACWVVELEAKSRQGIAYPMKVLYVSQDGYVVLRMEYYSRDKRLMKRIDVQKVQVFGDKYAISNMQIRDTLQNRGFTELVIDNIDVDSPISQSFFSLDSLSF